MLIKIVEILCINMLVVKSHLLPLTEPSFSKCTQAMCRKHFIGTSVNIILPKFDDQFTDSILKRLSDDYSLTITNTNRKAHIGSSASINKPQNFLFFVASRLELARSVRYLQWARMWNPLARILVIQHNSLVFAMEKSFLNISEIKKIFRIFMKADALEVYVIAFDGRHKLKIFSWSPFDSGNDCSKRVAVIRPIGECTSDRHKDDHGGLVIKSEFNDLRIIPSKLNDCPLAMTVLRMEPYTICSSETECDNGMEIRLFQAVSKSLGLKLELNVAEKLDARVYNDLIQRKSDLVVGGINALAANRHKGLSPTATYYHDEYTWCVPVADSISLWLNLFLIIDDATWGYFITILIFTIVAMYYFLKFHDHPENMYFAMAAAFFTTLSVSFPIIPNHPLLRTYMLIFYIYGTVYTATFNSFLISILTKPIELTQISSSQRLVSGQVVLYAEYETMAMYNGSSDGVSEYILRNFHSCEEIDLCLKTFLASATHNKAVAITKSHAINSQLTNEAQLFCFERPDNIYEFPVAALSHKHFRLLEVINLRIRHTFEAGLVAKWESDSKPMKKPKIVKDEVLIVISIQHISGGLLVLVIGLILALIAFVAERYFKLKHKSALNSEPSLWRLCEKLWVTTERDGWSEVMRYYRWRRMKRRQN